MATRDPRIDAYIAKSADFAQPILEHLRATVHAACPEVEETLKWSSPHFIYRARLLCGMSAFKHHVAFGFWLGKLVASTGKDDEAMGQFGCITRVADLPSRKSLSGLIRKAMALSDAGATSPSRTKAAKPRPPIEVPDDLAAAFVKNRKARATFDGFSNTNRREYVEWITEAKRADTRTRRLAQAIEWLAEGKPRNWKYMDC
jgi:uncharacterized protein YdeI (YjbR/CyaY-like superfamily)